MRKKLFSLFAALTLSVGLWAEGSVFTYTATEKLVESRFNQLGTVASHDFDAQTGAGTVTYSGTVTTIGQRIFQGCSSLQSITLPAGVTTIENYAFASCNLLQSVTLPEGLLTIGGGAFAECYNLASITIPAGVTEIGAYAFVVCYSLTSVTFEGTACTIGEDAFAEVNTAANPVTLVLPTNWTGSKPDQDGWWYGGYFNLTAPAPVEGDKFVDATSGLKFKVTAVGDSNTVMVIANDYSNFSYAIPATVNYNNVDFAVTEIGKNAFKECDYLESVTIPASVTTIGEGAFRDCPKLQSVTLSKGLLTIGEEAFSLCSSLQSVTLPEGLTEIGEEAFNGCGSLQSVTIPASVTTIGGYAFSGCESLQSITLPEGLLTIGEAAFYECSSLASITIPAGVTEIGLGAFYSCSSLTSVTFLGTACQNNIGEMAFYGVGDPTPAALTLPDNWTGTLPDEEGNWYSGKFELVSGPATALPIIDSEFKIQNSKLIINGQLIIRKNGKHFNAVGAEL